MSLYEHHEPTCQSRDRDDSPIALVVSGHEKDLGHLTVRRILPSALRDAVGPFVFFDHFGPTTLGAGQGWDVRPHPHVHLATVTYLFEGEQMHRDSVGSVFRVTPRALGWMNAGRGIVHSERTPDDLRPVEFAAHGIQAWVALPDEHEDSEPSFQQLAPEELPVAQRGGLRLRIIAGEAFGASSPVVTHTPAVYVEIEAGSEGGEVGLERALGERGVYLVSGEATLDGHALRQHTLSVVDDAREPTLRLGPNAHAMLVGGRSVGPRIKWWNFVGSTQERIDAAKRRWAEHGFERIESDHDERIPLPSE